MIKSTSCLLGGFILIACLAASSKSIAQINANGQAPAKDSSITVIPVEYVNVGYSTIPRVNLTGAVSTVDESRIKKLAAVSITSLLQAQAAGVKVVNTSGAPGAGAL
ncbi:MAG: hypothetical protein ABIR18_08860, partial [Chitinophagaceae bacterium]